MSDKKLSDLTAATTLEDADLLYMVDTSDTTDSPDGTSKKVAPNKVNTSYYYVQDPTSGATASTPPTNGDTPTCSYVLNDKNGAWLADFSFYSSGQLNIGNWVVDGGINIFGTYDFSAPSTWSSDSLLSYSPTTREVTFANLYSFDVTATVNSAKDWHYLRYNHTSGQMELDDGVYTATTTQIEDTTADVNTRAEKRAGWMVFNITTGQPVWAVNSGALSVWNDATGATAHSPT
jgi:hypothetical protein